MATSNPAWLVGGPPDGRFAALATSRRTSKPAWTSLLCDHHTITEVLLRFGRGADPHVARALETMADDLSTTGFRALLVRSEEAALPVRHCPASSGPAPIRRPRRRIGQR